jgi:CRP-like cAMP-binding protein
MTSGRPSPVYRARVASRLSQFAPLDAGELRALAAAEASPRTVAAHREIIEEGQPVTGPSIVLSGWAARCRIFADGRRQILGLLLPGDLIGVCRQNNPIAATGVIALTEVVLCPAPHPDSVDAPLAEAYARSGALEEYFLFRQIARLGRLNARERMVDLLLEIRDRLAAVGLASVDGFPLAMTQEMLADSLGLTSVHVNRTLQMLRRDGFLDLRAGVARLKNLDRLAKLSDHRTATVFGA